MERIGCKVRGSPTVTMTTRKVQVPDNKPGFHVQQLGLPLPPAEKSQNVFGQWKDYGKKNNSETSAGVGQSGSGIRSRSPS